MADSLPFTNQKYNNIIFRIAVYKLVDQAPGLISLTLDTIISNISGKNDKAFFKEVLPMSQSNLTKNDITIRYPDKKKVTYYWICKKLMQLLYWKEGKPAIGLEQIWENSKISFREINENILKVQQIMSDYAYHPKLKSELFGSDNIRPVESSALPSYENVIDDCEIVGTSGSHLTSSTHKDENFSEKKVEDYDHKSSSSFPEFKLQYCFSGSSKAQARDFINDYDSLALRNKWSSEDKMEFFPNHLENDALNWYLSIQEHLTSWKIVKMEFMQKYLAD